MGEEHSHSGQTMESTGEKMGTSVDMSDREGAGKSPHHSSSASNAEVSHIKAPSRAIDGDPEGTQR